MNPIAVKIIAGLRGDAALDAMEKWIERSAIAEYDGLQSREAAEELATRELIEKHGRPVQGELF